MGYQEKYNVELPNCIKFCNKNYYINDGGGREFIKNDPEALQLFDSIMMEDFEKLGLKVRKLSPDEVEKINKSSQESISKKYEKKKQSIYDLLGIKPKKKLYVKPKQKANFTKRDP